MRHFDNDDVIRPELLTVACILVWDTIGKALITSGGFVILPASIHRAVPVDEGIIRRLTIRVWLFVESKAIRPVAGIDAALRRFVVQLRCIQKQGMLERQIASREAA